MGKEIAWWQARLFLAKVVWSYDLELVSGQRIYIEKDLKVYGMYIKPCRKFRSSFIPWPKERCNFVKDDTLNTSLISNNLYPTGLQN